MAKTNRERLIRVDRKPFMPEWHKILYKVGAIILALLICAVISSIFQTKDGSFFHEMFVTTFASTKKGVTTFNISKTLSLFWTTAILFLIAIAITPAFKMKFWNLGGEGQILLGAFGTLVAMKFIVNKFSSNFLALAVMLIFGVLFAVFWALIPVIFKCLFNTNETLFTLMLNYIAAAIVGFFCYEWRAPGGTIIGPVNSDTKIGWFPQVTFWDGKQYNYIIAIILVIVIGVVMWAYLKYTKHGYELSVVGGSRNTAKYIGININLVIIRTMALSGVLAGICGWFLVAAGAHTITETIVNGRGFTGVLIACLGHFNPVEMAGYSFLVAFVECGGDYAASNLGYKQSIVSVFTGIFFFIVTACEFFINFGVHVNTKLIKSFFNKLFRKKEPSLETVDNEKEVK